MAERAEWTTTDSVSIDIDGPKTRRGDSQVDDYALTLGQDDTVLVIEGDLHDLLALARLIEDKIIEVKTMDAITRVLRQKGSHGGLQRA